MRGLRPELKLFMAPSYANFEAALEAARNVENLHTIHPISQFQNQKFHGESDYSFGSFRTQEFNNPSTSLGSANATAGITGTCNSEWREPNSQYFQSKIKNLVQEMKHDRSTQQQLTLSIAKLSDSLSGANIGKIL